MDCFWGRPLQLLDWLSYRDWFNPSKVLGVIVKNGGRFVCDEVMLRRMYYFTIWLFFMLDCCWWVVTRCYFHYLSSSLLGLGSMAVWLWKVSKELEMEGEVGPSCKKLYGVVTCELWHIFDMEQLHNYSCLKWNLMV